MARPGTQRLTCPCCRRLADAWRLGLAEAPISVDEEVPLRVAQQERDARGRLYWSYDEPDPWILETLLALVEDRARGLRLALGLPEAP